MYPSTGAACSSYTAVQPVLSTDATSTSQSLLNAAIPDEEGEGCHCQFEQLMVVTDSNI